MHILWPIISKICQYHNIYIISVIQLYFMMYLILWGYRIHKITFTYVCTSPTKWMAIPFENIMDAQNLVLVKMLAFCNSQNKVGTKNVYSTFLMNMMSNFTTRYMVLILKVLILCFTTQQNLIFGPSGTILLHFDSFPFPLKRFFYFFISHAY